MKARLKPAANAPEAVLTTAVLNAARLLGLSNRDLAAVLATSPASVSRLLGRRKLSAGRAEWELGLLFVRLYRSLDALVGGSDTKARRWLAADNEHLGGVPRERIKSIEGLVDVVRYLDAMRARI